MTFEVSVSLRVIHVEAPDARTAERVVHYWLDGSAERLPGAASPINYRLRAHADGDDGETLLVASGRRSQ